MFASSQPGAFICYRCQSKALRRLLPSSDRIVTSPLASLSRSRRQYSQTDGTGARRFIYPHGKLRGRKGGEVRESSAVLPVTALGKSAEIIILKDADIDRAEDTNTKPTAQGASQPKHALAEGIILQSLQEGSDLSDAKAVTQSLDKLRNAAVRKSLRTPKETHIEELTRTLVGGFTKKQLFAYVARARERQARDHYGLNCLDSSTATKIDIPHSSWIAGITSTEQAHRINRGLSVSYVAKTDVANAVITDCWGLYEEESSTVGEIDVFLAHGHFTLRDENGHSMLEQIAERRSVKIQSLTKNMVRITGDKEAATNALKDIQDSRSSIISALHYIVSPGKARELAAQGLVSGRVDKSCVSLASKYFVGDEDLKQITDLTGIQAMKIKDEQGKAYVKMKGHSREQIEDGQRAMFAISELRTRSKHKLVELVTQSSPYNRQAPVSEATFSYSERKETWYRKSGGLSRDQLNSSDRPPPSIKSLKMVLNKLDGVMAIARINQSSQSHAEVADSIWSSPKTSISTRIGQIYRSAGKQHVFTPCLPQFPIVLSNLPGTSLSPVVGPTRTVISFIFRHDPGIDKDIKTIVPNTLPEIKFDFEMEVSTSGAKMANLIDAFAVTNDYSLHIALPERPVDLSVNSRTSRSLQINAENSTITSAIEQMTASILGSGRLRAPLTMEFPFPSSSGSTNSTPETVKLPESMPVYRFVGVEYKQIATFEIEGRQASFTCVEGGTLGRSYSELRIMENERAAVRDIFERGLRIVDVVDRATRGLLKTSRPKDMEQKVNGVGAAKQEYVQSGGESKEGLNAWADLQGAAINGQVEDEVEERRAAAG